jgi:hypothetical protein
LNGSELIWYFPSTDGGDEQGINDTLRETFEGDHERYVARESIQNSMDARVDDTQPVRVRFERFDIPTSEIPGVDSLRDTIVRATEYAGSEDRVGTYEAAMNVLNQETVSVLKISDYNTTGLGGGDQKDGGKGWYKLVRATGVNQMSGVGGGSFGIGKGAPFAASILRTVFYSTFNEEGQHAFQGKARLSSFLNDDNDVRQGTGQFGLIVKDVKGVASVRDRELIPSTFCREDRGTDVYVVGYQTMEQDWKKLLLNSILNNFWAAIHFDDLNVELVDGEEVLSINSDNLGELMSEYAGGVEDSLTFYETVLNSDHNIEDNLPLLGRVKLFVRMRPGLPKKVQMMRMSKMVVATKNYRVLPEPYAAVFICDDPEGNKKLRELEPPTHDEWIAKRNKEFGKQVIKEMDDWMRKRLKEFAGNNSTEPEDIVGVSEYLPEIEERDDMKPYTGGDGEVMNTGTDEETAHEIGAIREEKPYNETVIRDKEVSIVTSAGTGEVEPVIRRGDPKPSKPTPPSDETVDPKEEGSVPLIDTASLTFRAREIVRQGNKMYQIVLSSNEDESGSIRLMAVGDDNEYPVEIDNVEDDTGKTYAISDAYIRGIDLKQNERLKLWVQLKQHKRYVLGVEANEG